LKLSRAEALRAPAVTFVPPGLASLTFGWYALR
jgi:hypothetical protein